MLKFRVAEMFQRFNKRSDSTIQQAQRFNPSTLKQAQRFND